jgi:hypothetical protein
MSCCFTTAGHELSTSWLDMTTAVHKLAHTVPHRVTWCMFTSWPKVDLTRAPPPWHKTTAAGHATGHQLATAGHTTKGNGIVHCIQSALCNTDRWDVVTAVCLFGSQKDCECDKATQHSTAQHSTAQHSTAAELAGWLSVFSSPSHYATHKTHAGHKHKRSRLRRTHTHVVGWPSPYMPKFVCFVFVQSQVRTSLCAAHCTTGPNAHMLTQQTISLKPACV